MKEPKWNVPKPQCRDQGSEALLKRQYNFCSKGEIGCIQAKHIISALPEEVDGGKRRKKRKKELLLPLGGSWNACT